MNMFPISAKADESLEDLQKKYELVNSMVSKEHQIHINTSQTPTESPRVALVSGQVLKTQNGPKISKQKAEEIKTGSKKVIKNKILPQVMDQGIEMKQSNFSILEKPENSEMIGYYNNQGQPVVETN